MRNTQSKYNSHSQRSRVSMNPERNENQKNQQSEMFQKTLMRQPNTIIPYQTPYSGFNYDQKYTPSSFGNSRNYSSKYVSDNKKSQIEMDNRLKQAIDNPLLSSCSIVQDLKQSIGIPTEYKWHDVIPNKPFKKLNEDLEDELALLQAINNSKETFEKEEAVNSEKRLNEIVNQRVEFEKYEESYKGKKKEEEVDDDVELTRTVPANNKLQPSNNSQTIIINKQEEIPPSPKIDIDFLFKPDLPSNVVSAPSSYADVAKKQISHGSVPTPIKPQVINYSDPPVVEKPVESKPRKMSPQEKEQEKEYNNMLRTLRNEKSDLQGRMFDMRRTIGTYEEEAKASCAFYKTIVKMGEFVDSRDSLFHKFGKSGYADLLAINLIVDDNKWLLKVRYFGGTWEFYIIGDILSVAKSIKKILEYNKGRVDIYICPKEAYFVDLGYVINCGSQKYNEKIEAFEKLITERESRFTNIGQKIKELDTKINELITQHEEKKKADKMKLDSSTQVTPDEKNDSKKEKEIVSNEKVDEDPKVKISIGDLHVKGDEKEKQSEGDLKKSTENKSEISYMSLEKEMEDYIYDVNKEIDQINQTFNLLHDDKNNVPDVKSSDNDQLQEKKDVVPSNESKIVPVVKEVDYSNEFCEIHENRIDESFQYHGIFKTMSSLSKTLARRLQESELQVIEFRKIDEYRWIMKIATSTAPRVKKDCEMRQDLIAIPEIVVSSYPRNLIDAASLYGFHYEQLTKLYSIFGVGFVNNLGCVSIVCFFYGGLYVLPCKSKPGYGRQVCGKVYDANGSFIWDGVDNFYHQEMIENEVSQRDQLLYKIDKLIGSSKKVTITCDGKSETFQLKETIVPGILPSNIAPYFIDVTTLKLSYGLLRGIIETDLNGGKRMKTQSFVVSIPFKLINKSNDDILKSYQEVCNFIMTCGYAPLKKPMLIALLNKTWRDYLNGSMFKYDCRANSMVDFFIKINEGAVITAGDSKYLITPTLGGYTYNGKKLGNYKSNELFPKKIAWIIGSPDQSIESMMKHRSNLMNYNISPFPFFHIYQAYGEPHLQLFDEIEQVEYNIACDLFIDSSKEYLVKGHPHEFFYPYDYPSSKIAFLFYMRGWRPKIPDNFDDYKKFRDQFDFPSVTSLSISINPNDFTKWTIKNDLFANCSVIEVVPTCTVTYNHSVTTKNLLPGVSPLIFPDTNCIEMDGIGHNYFSSVACAIPVTKMSDPVDVPTFMCPRVDDRAYVKIESIFNLLNLSTFPKIIELGVGDGGMRRFLKKKTMHYSGFELKQTNFEDVTQCDIKKSKIDFSGSFVVSDLSSQQGPNNEFGEYYLKLFSDPLIDGIVKVQGINENADWISLLSEFRHILIIKPFPSRPNNSEFYLYISIEKNPKKASIKQVTDTFYNVLYNYRNIELHKKDQYSFMPIVTPLKTMKLSDFAKYCAILNRPFSFFIGVEDAQSLAPIDCVLRLVNKDTLHVSGKNWSSGRGYALYNGKKGRVMVPTIVSNYILPKRRRYYQERDTLATVFNCVKSYIVANFDDFDDFGSGEAGAGLRTGDTELYLAAPNNVTTIDPIYNADYNATAFDFVDTGMRKHDVAMCIQSIHLIVKNYQSIDHFCSHLKSKGYKRLVYTTWIPSEIENSVIKISNMEVVWSNQRDTIVPIRGKIMEIPWRTLLPRWAQVDSDELKSVYDRVAICCVNLIECKDLQVFKMSSSIQSHHTNKNIVKFVPTSSYNVGSEKVSIGNTSGGFRKDDVNENKGKTSFVPIRNTNESRGARRYKRNVK